MAGKRETVRIALDARRRLTTACTRRPHTKSLMQLERGRGCCRALGATVYEVSQNETKVFFIMHLNVAALVGGDSPDAN